MSVIFEILDKDAGGRIGKLRTPHGTVETPTVMPVINPNIQLISPREMERLRGGNPDYQFLYYLPQGRAAQNCS